MNVYKEMGYAPVQTAKGGIFIDLGGKNEEDAILLTAHMDTLGAMVHTVKRNGRLKLTPLGGLIPTIQRVKIAVSIPAAAESMMGLSS